MLDTILVMTALFFSPIARKRGLINLLVWSAVVLFSLLFINPSLAQADIAFETVSSVNTGATTATTRSWSHTSQGNDRILLVGVSINTNTSVSSVTYAGIPLTRIAAENTSNAVRVSMWYLINPPVGSNTINVNMSAAARFVANAVSYSGVNQINPLGTPVTGRGSSIRTGSLSVPSASGEVVVDVFARRGDLTTNPITAGTGQTVRWNERTTMNNANTGVYSGGSSKLGQATTIMNWTWLANRAWAAAAVSLKPTIIQSDTTPPQRFEGLPSGELPSGTSEVALSVKTDESATCRFSNTAGQSYSAMPGLFSSTGGTTHTATISGLTNNTDYNYYLRCIDAFGNANADDFGVSFRIASTPPAPPDTTPPSKPEDLSTLAISSSEISLSWTASIDDTAVTGYKVYRDGSYLAAVTNNSFADLGLSPETQYSYRVSAYDEAGNESIQSNESRMTTLAVPVVPDTESPTTPTNLNASAVSVSQINLTWSNSTDNVAVAGYRIYRNGVHIETVTSNSYSDTGLTEGTNYSYVVTAVDTSGNESAQSNTSADTTPVIPPVFDPTAPLRFNGIPSGILSAGTTNTELSLQTNRDAVCKYSNNPNISFSSMTSTFSSTGGTIHTTNYSSLSDSTSYNIYVRCQVVGGDANTDDYQLSFAVATLQDTESPSKPSNLVLNSTSVSNIIFSWTASSDNIGIAGYRVFRDGALIGSTEGTSFVDSGIVSGSSYTYKVIAFDAAGNESVSSDELQASTPVIEQVPPVISNITVTNISSNSATINWETNEPSTSQVEYGFTSLYGATSDYNLVLTTNHHLTLTGLSSGATYNYRVRSEDNAGNIATSINYTFATLAAPDNTKPAAVEDIRATNIGTNSFVLNWTAPGDDGNNGQALQYDIRLSKNKITNSSWNTDTQLTGEPTPSFAGFAENYTVVGLLPGQVYYVAIKTIDDAGNISSISNVAKATTLNYSSKSGGGGRNTPDNTPPATPTKFEGLPANEQVFLRWINPEDEDFVRVVILRKKNSAPTSTTDGEVVYEGHAESIIDTGLKNDSKYYYAIYAFDRAGNKSELVVIKVSPNTESTQIDLVTEGQDVPTEENKFSIAGIIKFFRNLFFGSEGEDVGELQKVLARNEKIYPEALVTNYYGLLTRRAVERLQCAYGLVCSGSEAANGFGRVGPRTLNLLNSELAKNENFVPVAPTVLPRLSLGDENEYVANLQTFLATNAEWYPEGRVSGYYGEFTVAAVKRFQCAEGIVCEGEASTTGFGSVGTKTAERINLLSSGVEKSE